MNENFGDLRQTNKHQFVNTDNLQFHPFNDCVTWVVYFIFLVIDVMNCMILYLISVANVYFSSYFSSSNA